MCEHLAALAYAFAREIDRDPAMLLRWRGCEAQEEIEPAAPAPPLVMPEDAWEAGPLPEPRPLRPLPTGAVLKRLGPSGLRVGGTDLAEVLQRAYASFAASPSPLVLDALARESGDSTLAQATKSSRGSAYGSL